MDFNERTAREAKAISDQDECDDPDCSCHQDAGERPGDGAAEVTITEVYEDEPGWTAPAAGNTLRPGDFGRHSK